MPKVKTLVDGKTYDVAVGTKFLDLCQQQKAKHDFGCTVGSCGVCRLELVEGGANVDPITTDEKDTLALATDHTNARLGCQLVIRGDIAVRPVA
ncbi:MAG: (2Fe-2S)-binding protein [Planctomycetota bacterium]|nr:MAG: (2Fe-2S)-binding protein [Planctomycetota bacterium]